MSNYDKYCSLMSKIADVGNSISILNWDQEVYMPSQSATIRGQQIATMAGIHHELSTSAELGELLNELMTDESLSFTEKRNVASSHEAFTKANKYSTAFVQKMSQAISTSFQAWEKARVENDFQIFAPHLEALVELKIKETELIGYEDNPYDALLDEFEPGLTVKELDVLFEGVRNELVGFVKQINDAEQVDDSFMYNNFPHQAQWDFGIDLLKQMGYDFETGRQDVSTHPFTTSFGATDVRVTTRIDENNLSEMVWSTIHEGGHALYEQGLPADHYGLPSGKYLSLSIHESQSRIWENNIGRGKEYWEHNMDLAKQYFPEQLKEVTAQQFYKGANKVYSSLIRTNADELTYHFHVMIRYEIEKALINREIKVDDLPTVWNQKYADYLGVTVPNDKEGVLQDIHWSHGSFGYFPTYSLGSFYAAQFHDHAIKNNPSFVDASNSGDFSPILNWLRKEVHAYGKTYNSADLCEKITGEKLNFKYFMDYAKDKYTGIYEL